MYYWWQWQDEQHNIGGSRWDEKRTLIGGMKNVTLVASTGIINLKEYYEIVGELRPLSGFFPTHADLFTEMHFYMFQSDPSPNCFTIDV